MLCRGCNKRTWVHIKYLKRRERAPDELAGVYGENPARKKVKGPFGVTYIWEGLCEECALKVDWFIREMIDGKPSVP